MFRFLYIILLSLFFTSCSVKSNLIQDEFTNIKNKIPMIDVLIFHILV
ncbi:hypothetical protein MASR2M54_17480 [Aliarcobacter cryaerophilus]